jgi:ADP-ribose pyrophosphatase
MGIEWAHYLTLMEERPESFNNNGSLKIITDPRKIAAFEAATGKTIGVVYASRFHLLVVDLVQQGDGEPFAYERLLPAVPHGAVVMLPFFNEKLVLLRQYRHALRREQLVFPRGFAEQGLSFEENAVKELTEELGCQVCSVSYCGQVVADSGVDGTSVHVYACNVQDLHIRPDYEGIQNIITVTPAELETLIHEGQIDDGFTLAGYALWKCKNIT